MITPSDDTARPMASFVKLLVSDVDASARFYEALGFVKDGTDGIFLHLRWQQDAHVYLVRTPAHAALEGRRGVGVLLGFTSQQPDVAEVAGRAVRLQATVEGPRTTPWHTRELVVTDPDGYRLNFVQPA